MKRVTGIGGIFFKARDPQALSAWYQAHLGIDVQAWGGAVFQWQGPHNPQGGGTTVWSPFAADTTYFAPGQAPFMVNYRVDDLRALCAALQAEGVALAGEIQASEQGLFAWVVDPEGNKLELWQPPAGQ
ncbi:MAG: glyoxalase [Burkholderiales bacterium PBB5]|nr:MAG: glyoxalase [Burkholderiales bacterium PBB5]